MANLQTYDWGSKGTKPKGNGHKRPAVRDQVKRDQKFDWKGPSQKGPTQKGPDQKGPTQKGPGQKGPSQKGPSQSKYGLNT